MSKVYISSSIGIANLTRVKVMDIQVMIRFHFVLGCDFDELNPEDMKQLEYCNCPHLSSPQRQISKPVGVAQTVWVAEWSTVVRGKESEGVVIDSCTLQRRHDLPDGPVHFFNSVANGTTWCFPTKSRGARVGGVDVVEGYIKIKRLALSACSLMKSVAKSTYFATR